jgi:hypothetical protein
MELEAEIGVIVFVIVFSSPIFIPITDFFLHDNLPGAQMSASGAATASVPVECLHGASAACSACLFTNCPRSYKILHAAAERTHDMWKIHQAL